MGKNKARDKFAKPMSLREKIKEFRRNLHGKKAEAFDAAFIESAGNGISFRECLAEGRDLQKAFVLAKDAAALAKDARHNDTGGLDCDAIGAEEVYEGKTFEHNDYIYEGHDDEDD